MATRFVNKKTLAIGIIAVAGIVAVLAVANFAQARANSSGSGYWMHGGPPGYFGGGPYGHFGGMTYQGSEANWTGSVPLESVRTEVIEAIKSKVTVSVSEAESAAVGSIGDGSQVFSVALAPVNGYIVYVVHGIDSSNNLHRVIVDAGNGNVLDSAQVDMAGHGSWKAHGYGAGMWHQ
ncbi:MAG: PepSY domain-containing protein [Nitrososphaera sp.]